VLVDWAALEPYPGGTTFGLALFNGWVGVVIDEGKTCRGPNRGARFATCARSARCFFRTFTKGTRKLLRGCFVTRASVNFFSVLGCCILLEQVIVKHNLRRSLTNLHRNHRQRIMGRRRWARPGRFHGPPTGIRTPRRAG